MHMCVILLYMINDTYMGGHIIQGGGKEQSIH